MNKKSPRGKLNAVLYSILLREFLEGPTTATEAVEATGFSRKRMVGILRTMHRQKVLHIAEWEAMNLRNREPVYALGEGDDAPRPSRMTRNVRQQRFRVASAQRAVMSMGAGA